MRKKVKLIARAVLLLVTATAVFFAYGGGRTMTMSAKFTAHGFWSGLVIAGYSAALLLSLYTLCYLLKEQKPPSVKIIIPYAIAALSGIVVSEATIAADELAFKREIVAGVASPNPAEAHHRNRAWPNGTGQLHWSSARGFWSTD
jgi:hypothetical protein